MSDDDAAEPGMHKEQITLPDGRYLIYYTFDAPAGEPPSPSADRDV